MITNIYGSDGFLAQGIVVGFATNAYTYSNDLFFTHTDPRGLITTNVYDNREHGCSRNAHAGSVRYV